MICPKCKSENINSWSFGYKGVERLNETTSVSIPRRMTIYVCSECGYKWEDDELTGKNTVGYLKLEDIDSEEHFCGTD